MEEISGSFWTDINRPVTPFPSIFCSVFLNTYSHPQLAAGEWMGCTVFSSLPLQYEYFMMSDVAYISICAWTVSVSPARVFPVPVESSPGRLPAGRRHTLFFRDFLPLPSPTGAL
jgi:hypothetical protein